MATTTTSSLADRLKLAKSRHRLASSSIGLVERPQSNPNSTNTATTNNSDSSTNIVYYNTNKYNTSTSNPPSSAVTAATATARAVVAQQRTSASISNSTMRSLPPPTVATDSHHQPPPTRWNSRRNFHDTLQSVRSSSSSSNNDDVSNNENITNTAPEPRDAISQPSAAATAPIPTTATAASRRWRRKPESSRSSYNNGTQTTTPMPGKVSSSPSPPPVVAGPPEDPIGEPGAEETPSVSPLDDDRIVSSLSSAVTAPWNKTSATLPPATASWNTTQTKKQATPGVASTTPQKTAASASVSSSSSLVSDMKARFGGGASPFSPPTTSPTPARYLGGAYRATPPPMSSSSYANNTNINNHNYNNLANGKEEDDVEEEDISLVTAHSYHPQEEQQQQHHQEKMSDAYQGGLSMSKSWGPESHRVSSMKPHLRGGGGYNGGTTYNSTHQKTNTNPEPRDVTPNNNNKNSIVGASRVAALHSATSSTSKGSKWPPSSVTAHSISKRKEESGTFSSPATTRGADKAIFMASPPPVAAAPAEVVGLEQDNNVPTPEKDEVDPAEESGIGEKSRWVSPRSRRPAALDHSFPSSQETKEVAASPWKSSKSYGTATTIPSARGAYSVAAASTTKYTPSATIHPAEQIPLPPKVTRVWQSPQSARLKPLETHSSDISTPTNVAAESTSMAETGADPMETAPSMLSGSEGRMSSTSGIETRAKNSVSDMKAKLWGAGANEKLIVSPKLRSPVLSELNKTVAPRHVSNSPALGVPAINPKTTNSTKEKTSFHYVPKQNAIASSSSQKVVVSPLRTKNRSVATPPLNRKALRGSPDVSTPHGLDPPLRSSTRNLQLSEDTNGHVPESVPTSRSMSPMLIPHAPEYYDDNLGTPSIPTSPLRETITMDFSDVSKTAAVHEDPPLISTDTASSRSLEPLDESPTVFANIPVKEDPPATISSSIDDATRDCASAKQASLLSLPPRSSSQNLSPVTEHQQSRDSFEESTNLRTLFRCPSDGDLPVHSPSSSLANNTPGLTDIATDIVDPKDPNIDDKLEASPQSPVDNDLSPKATPKSPEKPPLSPILRRTNIPSVDGSKQSPVPTIPPRHYGTTKIPPFSPSTCKRRLAAGFEETIDCPPYDASEFTWNDDHDVTGPKEAPTELHDEPPMSPRPKQERPWNKDFNTLSPSSWQKRDLQPFDDDVMPPPSSLPLPNNIAVVDSMEEEKKSSDDFLLETKSPSSLMQMAADSIYAVDYEKAVAGFQKRTISEDEDSLLSGGLVGSALPAIVPPEFENAVSESGAAREPVFGDPTSFGAAGGELAAPPLKVADRAKAIATWNGGLGVSPTISEKQVLKEDLGGALSPIRFQRSDTENEDMSPRVSSRGYALDDWHRNKSFESKPDADSVSEFWQVSTVNDDKDWAKSDPKIEMLDTDSEAMAQGFFVPSPRLNAMLDKPRMDTGSRTMQFWRKQPTDFKPTRSQSKSIAPAADTDPFAMQPVTKFGNSSSNNVAFNPFHDPYGDKIDFTEATEFTEGTDFFCGSSDPFSLDPGAFEILEQFAPKASEEDYGHTHVDQFISSPPTLNALNPPSGSGTLIDVWDYDADTSHMHEGAAEI